MEDQMRLHEDGDLFVRAIRAASQWMTEQNKMIPEIFIEKDYWITFALSIIFKSDTGGYSIFKGGTSLSKCYKLLDRFSEDVDIVILKTSGDSSNALRNKLRAISHGVGKMMPEVYVNNVTNKMGMIRKTVHEYQKAGVTGDFGQVSDKITLESTWLSSPHPSKICDVSSYIGEMMGETGQHGLIHQFDMQPFPVRVLSIERTFCEKIMSLVRFSHGPQPLESLARKVRHIYDLHKIRTSGCVNDFFASDRFGELLNSVGKDDMYSYKSNNQWLKNHPKDAVIFNDTNETWSRLRNEYHSSFKEMVIGNLPDEVAINETIEAISARLRQIRWNFLVQ